MRWNTIIRCYFLSEMLLRNTFILNQSLRSNNTYRLPAVSHEFARHSISYRFPKIFNEMNQNIKDKIYTHSLDGFKYYVKQNFLQSYNVNCDLTNCYICDGLGWPVSSLSWIYCHLFNRCNFYLLTFIFKITTECLSLATGRRIEIHSLY